jgi:predicted secreted protein
MGLQLLLPISTESGKAKEDVKVGVGPSHPMGPDRNNGAIISAFQWWIICQQV